MKALLLVLALFFASQGYTKTCKAYLHGNLKHQEIYEYATKVFYPDLNDPYSRTAFWEGNSVTKKFIPPKPIEITCGTPWFMGYFEGMGGTGMFPPSIKTKPWTSINSTTGKPKPVEETTLYGFGPGGDYPHPSFLFKNGSPTLVNQPTPAGQDICDMSKLELPEPFKYYATIYSDPEDMTKYSEPSEYGSYKWDPTSAPVGRAVELELLDPTIYITCETQWKYEATFEWPYVVKADDESLCGPGEVHREMKLEGDFYMTEDNKVFGFMNVEKPTVTYSGTLFGRYTGEPFFFPMEGRSTDSSDGKRVIELPFLEGGDGISWLYSIKCPYGVLNNYLDNAAAGYVKIMNDQEEIFYDDEIGPMFRLNADLDEKTFNVDMRGQGQVTIKRSWKKVSP